MDLQEKEVIPLMIEASERGLKLGWKGKDTLTVQPAEACTPALAERLRLYKWHIWHVLKLPFVMVFSESLGETVFFCEDEATKAALIEVGADSWSIYTKDELRVLVAHNRIAPFSVAELRKVHEIKKTFNGKIAAS